MATLAAPAPAPAPLPSSMGNNAAPGFGPAAPTDAKNTVSDQVVTQTGRTEDARVDVNGKKDAPQHSEGHDPNASTVTVKRDPTADDFRLDVYDGQHRKIYTIPAPAKNELYGHSSDGEHAVEEVA